jgi:hypothetical protein
MEIHLRGAAGVRFVQSPGVYIDAPNALTPNRWTHIVCRGGSFNDGGGRVFIDGYDVGASATSGNPELPFTISGPAPVRIGQRVTQEQVHQFEGQIDDLRIYNRTLSRNEILQLFAFESFCSPHVAKATAVISGGVVTGAVISDLGCGYTTAPTVRVVGGGGTGATAIATMQAGLVFSITMTNGGSGYTSAPRILIESPAFVPTTTISVSRIKVTQHVRINHSYILESSSDLLSWTPTGPQYTAESEEVTSEFSVNPGDQFFRVREVP